MSDLISRSALLEKIKRYEEIVAGGNVLGDIVDIIQELPTAYNVEKVVQKLEEEKTSVDAMCNYGYRIGIAKAIEIVHNDGAYVPDANVGNNDWISVEKELPNVGVTVLCYWKKVNRYDNSTDFFYTLMHRNADIEWISDFGKCTGEVIAWKMLVPYVGEN